MNSYIELLQEVGIVAVVVLLVTFVIFLFEERQRIKEMMWEGKE